MAIPRKLLKPNQCRVMDSPKAAMAGVGPWCPDFAITGATWLVLSLGVY